MLFSVQEIDHVGIAVPSIPEAVEHYRRLHGLQVELRETVVSQATEVAFLDIPGSTIELLAPINGSGAVQKFLVSRGPGIHHICYAVADIDLALKHYAALGVRLIDHQARPGARNTRIAFLHPKDCSGVLTELCEYTKQAM